MIFFKEVVQIIMKNFRSLCFSPDVQLLWACHCVIHEERDLFLFLISFGMCTKRHKKLHSSTIYDSIKLETQMSISIGIDKLCYITTMGSPRSFRSKTYSHATPIEGVMLESSLPVLRVDKHQGWMNPSPFKDW